MNYKILFRLENTLQTVFFKFILSNLFKIKPYCRSDVHCAPIVADAEAGFGGSLNAYELMRGMIEAGVAGVHFEDQLASAKKCGHMGGKVLVPTSEFIRKLTVHFK